MSKKILSKIITIDVTADFEDIPDTFTIDHQFDSENIFIETTNLDGILSANPELSKRIWTAVEVDTDEIDNIRYIPGVHYVNRMWYVLTHEEFKHNQ